MSERAGLVTARGRRPGSSEQTKSTILAAARGEFASKGYDAASIRGIARVAGVDPALVHHYFHGKEDLFARALELPEKASVRITDRLDGVPRDQIGAAFIGAFLDIWDPPAARERYNAMVRGAIAVPDVGLPLRQFLQRAVLLPIVRSTGVPNAELRAAAAASQIIGLGLFRYVLEVAPVAQASPEELIPVYGPILQRYLVDA